MQSDEAKAFRAQMNISKNNSTLEEGLKAVQVVEGDDKLRARLAAWQRAVDEARAIKGGEEATIWALERQKEAEREEKERIKREKE